MAMLDPEKEELKLVPEGEQLTVHLPMEYEKWEGKGGGAGGKCGDGGPY